MTIRQLLNAQHPHPDADFKIDGTEVTEVGTQASYMDEIDTKNARAEESHVQITFVGQVRNISIQTTNVTYKLDDGTAIIEAKAWNESDNLNASNGPKQAKKAPVEGEYARVCGRLRDFNNKRTVGAHVIRKIADFNEVQYHLLEATVVHLYFLRGSPGDQASKGGGAPGPTSFGQSGAALPSESDTGPHYRGGQAPQISSNARRVYDLLRTSPQNNEGLHMHYIATRLNMAINDVLKAGDELQSQSLIFSTVDDDTWAPLET